MKIECLYEGRFKLAEGPVWCDQTQSLWWVNMVEPSAVYRLVWGEAEPEIFIAPCAVTGVVLTQDGYILAASVGVVFRLDPRSGSFEPVIRLTVDKPGNRCNEISVDPWGNLWIGTMTNNLSGAEVNPTSGALIRIAPDGLQCVVLDEIGIPNTIVWDARGCLLTADSATGAVRRLQFSSTGMVTDVSILHGPVDIGVPDGSALAADGTLWNARWSAGCLLGIDSNGRVIKKIDVPGGNITSACFAGPDLNRLVVTSSSWGLSEEELARLPEAGGIFAIEGVGTGMKSNRYATNVGTWMPIRMN